MIGFVRWYCLMCADPVQSSSVLNHLIRFADYPLVIKLGTIVESVIARCKWLVQIDESYLMLSGFYFAFFSQQQLFYNDSLPK